MEGIHPHDHTDEVTKWDLILPISPVTGAVYLEPYIGRMVSDTPHVSSILPSRVELIEDGFDSVELRLKDGGLMILHPKYRGRANEIAYWFEVAADLLKEEKGDGKQE